MRWPFQDCTERPVAAVVGSNELIMYFVTLYICLFVCLFLHVHDLHQIRHHISLSTAKTISTA